jgi:hypothetical protein
MAASTLIILFPKKSENFYKNLKETKLCKGNFLISKTKKSYEGK